MNNKCWNWMQKLNRTTSISLYYLICSYIDECWEFHWCIEYIICWKQFIVGECHYLRQIIWNDNKNQILQIIIKEKIEGKRNHKNQLCWITSEICSKWQQITVHHSSSWKWLCSNRNTVPKCFFKCSFVFGKQTIYRLCFVLYNS